MTCWARLRPEQRHHYPVTYQAQWFRVVEGDHPDIPALPGQIWIDRAGAAQQVPAAHFDIEQRTRKQILVVDDDPSIRQTLQIALSNAGYEVFQARDGEEATRLWHEKGPDLIIADIHMPRRSGLLLIQDLQTHRSSTSVIAMTDGGPARNFKLLGLAELLGSVRTVAKPFTLEGMITVVNEELGRE
jgi:CheY-like chemotaxis protein